METTGLDLHFCPLGKNCCSHQCLHWWQQGSTGALHLDGFESLRHDHKKITTRMGGDFLWWRLRDSICIFALWAKNIVATSVCTGGSKAPPEPCIWMGSSPSAMTIKKSPPEWVVTFLWWRLRDSICIFAFWAKIIVATSVCTGGSKAPPEPCVWMGSSPSTMTIKKSPPEWVVTFYGGDYGTRFAFLPFGQKSL